MSITSLDTPDVTADHLDDFPVRDNEHRIVTDTVVEGRGTYWFLLRTTAETWIADSEHASRIANAEMHFPAELECRHLMAAVLRRDQVEQETVNAARSGLQEGELEILREYQMLPKTNDQV